MANIELQEYSISQHKYLGLCVSVVWGRWWWLFSLPSLLCIILSAVNLNFLYVSVMAAFMAYTILILISSYYGLQKEIKYSIQKKIITFTDSGVAVHYVVEEPDEEDEKDDSKPILKDEVLDWNIFKSYQPKSDVILLFFKNKSMGFVAIPYTAFKSVDDLKASVNLFREKIII